MLVRKSRVVFFLIISIIVYCSDAKNPENIWLQLEKFTTQYYTNPQPNLSAPLLQDFLRSELFTDEEMSDPLYYERLKYFFARVAQLEPKVLPEYLTIFEQSNHKQRSFMVDVLSLGGNKKISEYFESKLHAGRFLKESQQIEASLSKGIPLDFNILDKVVYESADLDYLLAEFMITGDETPILKIIDFIVEPNSMQAEPNDLKFFTDYGKTLLTDYGKEDNKILQICKNHLPESSGSTREVLENIVDQIDGSISITRFIEQAKNEKPVTGAKAWALGASAVLIERNHDRHDYLSPDPINETNIKSRRKLMDEWWGIKSQEDLFNNLESLMRRGHRWDFERWGSYLQTLSNEQYQQVLNNYQGDNERLQEIRIAKEYYKKLGIKSILGWDLSRYIFLCRSAYLCGYINEEQAWEKIMPVAKMLQKIFDSWEDLGQNYLIGRQFWSYKETKQEGYGFEDAYQRLLDMKSSPWNLYLWDFDLTETDPNEFKQKTTADRGSIHD